MPKKLAYESHSLEVLREISFRYDEDTLHKCAELLPQYNVCILEENPYFVKKILEETI